MKKITLVSLAAAAAIASVGCSTAPTANTVKTTNLNANTAVVVNANTAMGVNANAMGMNTNSSSRYGSNMSRADYEKNETEYKADQAASTIGQGADDKWIWFKTKAALATVGNVRDSTINVDVNNAVITLRGTVATKEEKDKAVAAAKGIEGQKGIKDELKVQAGDSITNQATGGSTTDGDKKAANANVKH